ncbi:pyridoxal phosphate-dependent transferase [Cantharellus anzutake]|uniref:pyridoxal phosphate-dependent transferase n=1 Tax=Cantharellus anzutake TaxID=1750568 RepID=UPI0019047190|nr:pyridoxal phosphate-dependent transferase [Cantharellus anzutake]KAF8333093.1 pyridoxal phosphate-dependent transferase [Cantharellus anzutake]
MCGCTDGCSLAGMSVPRYELAEEEMPPRTAARFIHDHLLLDGEPQLNLASFVTTYMEEEAEKVGPVLLNVNFIDVEEYPASGEIETRCVNMIARLFNAPLDRPDAEALGVSTIGSSEAIILSVLAAKRRWKNKRVAEGKSTDHPNIVMSAAVQVCWEKAARYLEVEERYWFCKPGQYVINPKEAADLVDENTVLVVAILGTTYTGQYEDVATLNDELEKKNREAGLDVQIHVDAASGGFVAPFIRPDLVWDFRLPLVSSINVSGHKYGLSYAGVGWAIWRNKTFLPDDILFTVNYLGSPQVSFTLNFSKSAVQVIGQYYQLLRLGKAGYRAIMTNLTATSDYLAEQVLSIKDGELFELLSDIGGAGLPLVAWKLKKELKYDEFAIARDLRQRGWIVPAYTMAPKTETMKLLRVVVREDFSRDRCEAFLTDLRHTIEHLETTPKVVLDHLDNSHQANIHNKASRSEKYVPDEAFRILSLAMSNRPSSSSSRRFSIPWVWYYALISCGRRRRHHHHEKHSLSGKYGKTHGVSASCVLFSACHFAVKIGHGAKPLFLRRCVDSGFVWGTYSVKCKCEICRLLPLYSTYWVLCVKN